ncbi:MAG: GalNAc(5)-diNAcBac-PP-undecaprenol beta-1,3-glucosyltransferase [Dehalococcoidia bacterium]|nr:GalNAc(5)-diNAcBac-PP-undecaprenol beta-1,3-glucosyltransferase [Bacillota bacterium]
MISPVENSPLLSIVIPTRNRQKYAISAIISILSITAPDLELVVHDNSDSRDLEEYIRSNINDTRLRYNYTSTPKSMVDNWDAAVGLASGKYLCLIGDDDGVNPEIIEATRWADLNDIDALKPTVRVSYLWPESGVPSTLFTKVSPKGVLAIQPFSGKVTKPDPEVEMRKVVQSGGFKYLETEIPRLYHGIVKRKCLNEVRGKTGAFFGGLSPDIFVALAIANFAKNVISIDYPLTIAGACEPSGSATSQRGEHVGNLEDAPDLPRYVQMKIVATREHVGNPEDTPHFRYRGTYKWSEIIPRFYSVQTVWADSTVAALKALGRDDILRDFNLPLLAAYCVAAHPKYRRIILRDMYNSFRIMNKNQLVGTFQFCYSLLLCCFKRELLIKLIPKRIKRILLVLLGITRINDVKDIAEATNIMTDHLRKTKKRFLDFVS